MSRSDLTITEFIACMVILLISFVLFFYGDSRRNLPVITLGLLGVFALQSWMELRSNELVSAILGIALWIVIFSLVFIGAKEKIKNPEPTS